MRTVRSEKTFDDQAHAIEANAARFDQIMDAAVWAVARNAELCAEIAGTNLRYIGTDPFPGAPELWIYFTIDDADYCTLQFVVEAPASE